VTVASEAIATWRPARAFASPHLPREFTASGVVHRVTGGKVRTEVWVR